MEFRVPWGYRNPSTLGISNRLKSSAGEGDRTLKRYAADTGGRAFFPSTTDELQMAFKAIERELRGQYSLSYDSTNSNLDGKFRRVKISLPRHQGLTVRAKKGYFAPVAGPDKVSGTSRPAPNPSLTRANLPPVCRRKVRGRIENYRTW